MQTNVVVELVTAILWMVFGAGVFSFTIGNLASVLANFDSQAAKVTLKMAQLNEFCKDAKIPKKLQEELRDTIEYTTQKGTFSWVEKQKIFAELPSQLKSDVSFTFPIPIRLGGEADAQRGDQLHQVFQG
jgi:hypothetical protein